MWKGLKIIKYHASTIYCLAILQNGDVEMEEPIERWVTLKSASIARSDIRDVKRHQ